MEKLRRWNLAMGLIIVLCGFVATADASASAPLESCGEGCYDDCNYNCADGCKRNCIEEDCVDNNGKTRPIRAVCESETFENGTF